MQFRHFNFALLMEQSRATQIAVFQFFIVAILAGCDNSSTKPELTLEPRDAVVEEAVIAGEEIKMTFALVNSMDGPVSVLATRTSCGCTEIAINGKHSVSEQSPIELPVGKSKLDVAVTTQMKGGPTQYRFEILYKRPDGVIQMLDGTLSATVCRGLIANPPSISISPEKAADPIRIDILDDFVDDYSIERIEVSDETMLRATFDDFPKYEQDLADSTEYIGNFSVRHALRIEFLSLPVAVHSRAWVRVYSNFPQAKPVEIPIHIVETRANLDITPETMSMLPADALLESSRTFALRSAIGWSIDPHVDYPSDLCSVKIETMDDPCQRSAIVTLKPAAVGKEFAIRFVDWRNERLTLPVQVRTPDRG